MTAHIGGLEILAPLSLEDERRLYPVILRGRQAASSLARSLADEPARRRWRRQRQAGQEAESLLLRATLGLVRRRVHERGYRFGNEELEAAGVEGLANALRRFDPARGVRFATYANYWIVKLVNLTVQAQLGVSDADMRLVLAVEKLQRARPAHPLGIPEVANALGVTEGRAQFALGLAHDVAARRHEPASFSDAVDVHEPPGPRDAPEWVINALKRLCGEDFDAFWQRAFHTTSLEELAAARGISRQALTKRLERCRGAVRASADAQRLRDWFAQQ